MITVGTAQGVIELAKDGEVLRRALGGAAVRAVSGDWAITDRGVISLSDGRTADLPDGLVAHCVLARPGGRAVAGTSEAHVIEIEPDGAFPLASFDAIPTRDEWYTPWGAPPDTRSLAEGAAGLLVNVHVGGVWREHGDQWAETVEVDADAHQVTADGPRVAVAAAVGVGQSDDGGTTWSWSADGLHASYCRAVAIADAWLLASASTGPSTRHGSLYRRPLDDPGRPFEPCGGGAAGLPERFGFNLDTHQLAAAGHLVALGTADGDVYLSDDAGATWRRTASDLPRISSVALTG